MKYILLFTLITLIGYAAPPIPSSPPSSETVTIQGGTNLAPANAVIVITDLIRANVVTASMNTAISAITVTGSQSNLISNAVQSDVFAAATNVLNNAILEAGPTNYVRFVEVRAGVYELHTGE